MLYSFGNNKIVVSLLIIVVILNIRLYIVEVRKISFKDIFEDFF